MKILITGINGLIGQSVANYLLSQGYDVAGVGRRHNINLDNNIRFYKLDLSEDYRNYSRVLDEYFDLVIHCAAQQPSGETLAHDFYNSNVLGTFNILSWMRLLGMNRIIHLSTLAFLKFSSDSTITHSESSLPLPVNAYTLSKASAEKFLSVFSRSEGFISYCLRIPSVVHPKQKGGVVHTYFDSAYNKKSIQLYDMGIMKRNLINTQSIIQAIESIINSNLKDGFNLYNLGSKDSWDQMKIAQYFYSRLYSVNQILPVDKSSTITGHWNINLSKSKTELDYKPWPTEDILNDYLKSMLQEPKL